MKKRKLGNTQRAAVIVVREHKTDFSIHSLELGTSILISSKFHNDRAKGVGNICHQHTIDTALAEC